MAANVPYHVVLHCSDSAWGSAEVIDEWHRERGFLRDLEDLGPGDLKHVGYQYVITNGYLRDSRNYDRKADGLITACRRETERGAHVRGYNHKSVGICLISKDGTISGAQSAALLGLVLSVMWRWQIPPSRVLGHREIDTAGKTCPGAKFDLDEFRRLLHEVVPKLYEAIDV